MWVMPAEVKWCAGELVGPLWALAGRKELGGDWLTESCGVSGEKRGCLGGDTTTVEELPELPDGDGW
eukprot:scaffold1549_cov350-Prasinococcus_capsulatus_cf.AAC.16